MSSVLWRHSLVAADSCSSMANCVFVLVLMVCVWQTSGEQVKGTNNGGDDSENIKSETNYLKTDKKRNSGHVEEDESHTSKKVPVKSTSKSDFDGTSADIRVHRQLSNDYHSQTVTNKEVPEPDYDGACDTTKIMKTRIFNGKEERDHPSLAAIYFVRTSRYLCGASILTRNYALTARHCIADIMNVSEINLLVGVHDLKSFPLKNVVKIKFIIWYGNGTTFHTDIALLMTDTIKFDSIENAERACLPWNTATYNDEGEEAILMGWGYTDGSYTVSPVVKKLNVRIYDMSRCRGDSEHKNRTMNICTYSDKGGSCRADSGSPVYKCNDYRMVQIGIVVAVEPAINCTKPGYSINLRLAPYLDWIRSYLNATVVPEDPCVQSPCGPNSHCHHYQHHSGGQAVCSCLKGYSGTPPNCQPECEFDSDCAQTLACDNQKCINPCLQLCDPSALCQVIDHSPICSCPPGQTGDPPFSACHPLLPPVEPQDLCQPSPCGPGMYCSQSNGVAVCSSD